MSHKDSKSLIRFLREQGITVVPTRRGHWKATHPAATRPVWIETSPSDCRSTDNKLAELRRYGFPMPEPENRKRKEETP